MRKTMLALVIVAFAAIAAFALFARSDQQFKTATPRSYELFQQGFADLNSFKYAAAETVLAACVEEDPDFAMGRALYAALLYRMGRNDEAAAQAERANELVATIDDDIQRVKTQLYLASMVGTAPEERDSMLSWIEPRQPDDLLVLSVKAAQLFNQNDPAASDVYRHMLEIEPNYAVAYNQLGYAAANDGDYDQAVAYLKKYAFLAPDLANPHDSLGEVLLWSGQYDEAAKEFRQAIKVQPDFFYSLINLGQIYLEKGQIIKGQQLLKEVRSQIAGTNFEQRIDELVAGTLFRLKMYDEAMAALESQIPRAEPYTALYLKAMLAAGRRDIEGGRAEFAAFADTLRASDIFKRNARVRENLEILGHQYAAFEATAVADYETAAAEWGEMLKLTKDRPPHQLRTTRIFLAESLLKTGDPARARKLAKEALSSNPNDIPSLLVWGRAALDLQRPTEARAALDRLLVMLAEADPGLPAIATAAEMESRLAEQMAALQG